MTQPSREQIEQADLQALSFEALAARQAAQPVRQQIEQANQQIFALYAVLAGQLDGDLPEALRGQMVEAIAQILSEVRIAVGPLLRRIAGRGIRLGIDQAGVHMPAEGVRATVPPDMLETIGKVDGKARADLQSAITTARLSGVKNLRDVQRVVAQATKAANRVESNTRWVANRAVAQGTGRVAEAHRMPRLWVAERDACLACLAYSGQVALPGEPFPEGLTFADRSYVRGVVDDPPLHPNCVPAGVAISSPPISAGYKRWYTGDMVEIRTQGSHVLPATPNHPILTPDGWVPIGQLHAGSYVVAQSMRDGESSADPGEHHEPPRIEQVFGALCVSGGVVSMGMVVSAEDFHGDGTDGDVDVVFVDGLLGGGVQVGEPFKQQQLVGAGRGLLLHGGCASDQRPVGAWFALDAAAPRHGASQALFGGLVGGHDLVGFGPTAEGYSGFGEDAGDCRPGDTVADGELFDALPGSIRLDQIVEVRRFPFGGYVYNLQTRGGWYSANGIVTHNCRCRLVLWPGRLADFEPTDLPYALRREAQRSVLRGFTNYASEPMALRAADRLLQRGTLLPRSVVDRARRDVAAGGFGSAGRGRPSVAPRGRSPNRRP